MALATPGAPPRKAATSALKRVLRCAHDGPVGEPCRNGRKTVCHSTTTTISLPVIQPAVTQTGAPASVADMTIDRAFTLLVHYSVPIQDT